MNRALFTDYLRNNHLIGKRYIVRRVFLESFTNNVISKLPFEDLDFTVNHFDDINSVFAVKGSEIINV
jgi:hypothetical protein